MDIERAARGSDSTPPSLSLGDLSDDPADTWRNLKAGLLALDAGAGRGDVASGWRENHRIHWDHHATSAPRALMLHSTDRGQAPRHERWTPPDVTLDVLGRRAQRRLAAIRR